MVVKIKTYSLKHNYKEQIGGCVVYEIPEGEEDTDKNDIRNVDKTK